VRTYDETGTAFTDIHTLKHLIEGSKLTLPC